jgi:hypothetical protein
MRDIGKNLGGVEEYARKNLYFGSDDSDADFHL